MVNILVLNYARPAETEKCLKSIRENCLFEHRVILLNNGAHNQDFLHSLFKQGFINFLINEPENLGGGGGTVKLFESSKSEYSLWIECDVEIGFSINQDLMNSWISYLENNHDNVKCIDLTGGICGQNVYSGRCFFINTAFYNSIDKFEIGPNGEKLYGGPGPYNHVKYLEQFIQEYFKENGYNVAQIPVIKDNGYSSVRENPDKSLWQHEPDTKKLYLLKGPVTQKYIYPKFTDEEWDFVLKLQMWPPGNIPQNERADSFIVPHWH